MCFLGVSMMNNHIWGSKTPILGAWIGKSSQLCEVSSDMCIRLTWNLACSCGQQQTLWAISYGGKNNSKMADGRHFENRYIAISHISVLVARPRYVSHCRILSPDKTEWWLISATLCGWRRCFMADQLWLMSHIREEVKNHPISMKCCTQQQILNWMNVTWSEMKKLHWTDYRVRQNVFLVAYMCIPATASLKSNWNTSNFNLLDQIPQL